MFFKNYFFIFFYYSETVPGTCVCMYNIFGVLYPHTTQPLYVYIVCFFGGPWSIILHVGIT